MYPEGAIVIICVSLEKQYNGLDSEVRAAAVEKLTSDTLTQPIPISILEALQSNKLPKLNDALPKWRYHNRCMLQWNTTHCRIIGNESWQISQGRHYNATAKCTSHLLPELKHNTDKECYAKMATIC